ncbi:MAG: hypothetical protein K8J08_03560 [Thermoanaerobaculia bacterium]|nr:hypothetical protein [Thermoanaerobaculia bacterium]
MKESLGVCGYFGTGDGSLRPILAVVFGRLLAPTWVLWEAIANDDSNLYIVASHRILMGLRDDPRFKEVVTELGLPILPLPSFSK